MENVVKLYKCTKNSFKFGLNAVFSINKKALACILSLLKVADYITHFWVTTIVKLLFYQKNSESKHLFEMFI